MNLYLFSAFAACWAIFMFYAWVLSRGQARLRRELDDLRNKLQDQPPARHSS